MWARVHWVYFPFEVMRAHSGLGCVLRGVPAVRVGYVACAERVARTVHVVRMFRVVCAVLGVCMSVRCMRSMGIRLVCAAYSVFLLLVYTPCW